MSVEVNVVGTKCGAGSGGLSCTYCYQAPVRRADGNAGAPELDLPAVKRAVLASGCTPRDGFSVFGGEPLLADLADLKALWSWGLEQYGKNGVQTSGRPVTEAHLELFLKYKVHVGFSIDGPGELNEARVAGTRLETHRATTHSIDSLMECLRRGIGASLIVTLSTHNASASRLPKLVAWLRNLSAAGLRDARLHVLEIDAPHSKLIALTPEENEAAMVACHALEADTPLRFDVFKDIRKLLRAQDDDGVTCVWGACDPWTTPAVHGISMDGGRYLCERVHKDGKRWAPAKPGPMVRQLILASTPQEDGGCKGCRFLITCKGQCPGTAIGGDWRKRSVDCELWKSLFTRVEGELEAAGEVPVSKRADLPALEARMVAAWAHGASATVQACVEDRAPTGAGQHGDAPHGDSHGDAHGDAHGDHTDMGGQR